MSPQLTDVFFQDADKPTRNTSMLIKSNRLSFTVLMKRAIIIGSVVLWWSVKELEQTQTVARLPPRCQKGSTKHADDEGRT